VAGTSGPDDLVIADGGRTAAVVVVAPGPAGRSWEYRAAADLVKYIEMMSGAKPELADTRAKIEAALKGEGPVLLVGSEALRARGGPLQRALATVAKKKPLIRADAMAVQREGNRVYLAGLTDDGHYHAVACLLQAWGCHWYLPSEFGECIPEQPTLRIGKLDYAHASPFEFRFSRMHAGDFFVRNFNSVEIPSYPDFDGVPTAGHALYNYIKDIVPPGKNLFNSPISDDAVIEHVAAKLENAYRDGKGIPRGLGMNDGVYVPSGSDRDARLQAGLWDKYFASGAMSDVFLTLYNGVAERLQKKYPNSPTKIGFFAYCNLMIPPQQVDHVAEHLWAVLAPIDIDPIHGMDDRRAAAKQEYRDMMYRWGELMKGRIWIYDYDQSMLVWRDMPNPSHQAFRQDVKHYRKAGVLGFDSEMRTAFATLFLNIYFRSQLMWDPDFDTEAALAEFYPAFYGPAAEPMKRYWSAIYRAWEETIATEHEFIVAPAIYTDSLIETLRPEVAAAEKIVASYRGRSDLTRNERLYLKRVEFTRHSFDVIDGYMSMVRAAWRDCDYARAGRIGRQALAARETMRKDGGLFVEAPYLREAGGEKDPAWFPGEVKMTEDLAKLTDGTAGKLVAKLPLAWSFLRDPNDSGLPHGVARRPADLTYWKEHGRELTGFARRNYPPMTWEEVRADLYPQAQGILHPDGQAFTGYSWYKTDVDLKPEQLNRPVHIRFPGLFAQAWLYVNGRLVEHRPQQKEMYSENDYTFAWDVDVNGDLHPGRNDITLRSYNSQHVSGIFRRPFLYQPVNP
jgi:hypothetical protein